MTSRPVSVLSRLIPLVALLAALLAVPGPALAATDCVDFFDNVTINGNLVVPADTRCDLDGTTVTGNVTVNAGATLYAYNSAIYGNIRGNGAATVEILSGAVVNGNVALTNMVDGDTVNIYDATVRGSVTLTGNDMTTGLFIAFSAIGGNVVITGNATGANAIEIRDNEIGGSLRCEGNTLLPSVSGNDVNGRVTGQCAPV